MNKLITLLVVVLLLTPFGIAARDGKTLVIVTRNYAPRPASEKASIVIDYKSLLAKAPFISNGFSLTDGNFGRSVAYRLLDDDKNGTADQVVIDFTFTSDEPLFSFSVESTSDVGQIQMGHADPNPRLSVTCLLPGSQWLKSGKGPVSWPDVIIESTMAFYPDPALLPLYAPGNYSYEYAFFLSAMLQRFKETGKDTYYAYVKKWADRYLD